MGLLNLFDKKQCAICGGDIGMLGNRKLADGNMCKNCASKLSPWMTDRRECTVQEIKEHLAYREENKRGLSTLHPTRVFGSGREKLYVDADKGVFFISGERNWQSGNPDIIAISQVTQCDLDIREHREEQYRKTPDGKRVSYTPPRYEYSYAFKITIGVNSPYFDVVDFELTDDYPTSRESTEYEDCEFAAQELRSTLMPGAYNQHATAQNAGSLKDLLQAAATAVQSAASSVTKVSSTAKEAKGDKWICPKCASACTGNFCPNCGAKRPLQAYRCDKCGWVPDDPTNPPKFCPNCGDPFTRADKT